MRAKAHNAVQDGRARVKPRARVRLGLGLGLWPFHICISLVLLAWESSDDGSGAYEA